MEINTINICSPQSHIKYFFEKEEKNCDTYVSFKLEVENTRSVITKFMNISFSDNYFGLWINSSMKPEVKTEEIAL